MARVPIRTRHALLAGLLGIPILLLAQNTPAPSDALFNDSTVQRLELRIHSADWEKLKQNFRENDYYPADFVFNDQTVRNVGIRSRGGGSRSGTKPGLRVDFDRYATDQQFLGLKSFVLDNLTQDSSGVRETMAMKVFAAIGIPAPREAHVRLYINGAYAGLYVAIESIDKDFLARAFGSIGNDVQNDGFLFEFEWLDAWRFTYLGSNLGEYKPRFNPHTRETASDAEKYGPIEALVRLANETRADRYTAVLAEYLDLPAFMRFVAAQNFIAEKDGFLGYDGMNNFYLYRRENTNQHVVIPWDDDNAFRGEDWPIFAGVEDNVLTANAIRVPELESTYVTALRDAVREMERAVDGANMSWFEYEMRRQLDLIADAMREDPAKPYSDNEHQSVREEMIAYARNRTAHVREQLVRHGFGAAP
jgi:spore coat protein CotH